MGYIKPTFGVDGFTCPGCDMVTLHNWWKHKEVKIKVKYGFDNPDIMKELVISSCISCGHKIFWEVASQAIVFPALLPGIEPSKDMPEDVKAVYQEARAVFEASPRASAALLRLGLQLLCHSIGVKNKRIDDDIKELVAKGASKRLQIAMDSVRYIGNEAVHPGQIDLNDNREIALVLFGLLNRAVNELISADKDYDALNELLPQGVRDAIAKRDKPKS